MHSSNKLGMYCFVSKLFGSCDVTSHGNPIPQPTSSRKSPLTFTDDKAKRALSEDTDSLWFAFFLLGRAEALTVRKGGTW